jgi:hypothetical protein
MRVTELFREPGRIRRLARHAWRHFREDRCFEEAASLGYTSLLAMVPLLAVTVGFISVFPVFERWSDDLQDFIFKNFVPAAGEQVQTYVEGFLGSATQLTLSGTVALVIVALLLMHRIENAFNRIWRVTAVRCICSAERATTTGDRGGGWQCWCCLARGGYLFARLAGLQHGISAGAQSLGENVACCDRRTAVRVVI